MSLPCLNCQDSICRINPSHPPCQDISPETIINAVNKRIEWNKQMKVSAVVAIYRPQMPMLNRCLLALLNQVDEIVVVSDQAGQVPAGAMEHAKIRYIKSWQKDIGYGRKAQLGARNTYGGWILFCNDDVELNPGCVQKMLVEGVPDVGVVSCLLRYRDGTIQHAGKTREPNVRGWGHIDHRKIEPTFKEATEAENTCGALTLVRRKCFYDAGAFDEDFYLYCEDDSFCLSARKAGWRIVYTPHATAIHDEHKSTELTPHIVDILHQSNALFEKKWGQYLDWNRERIPGNFDYLNAKPQPKS